MKNKMKIVNGDIMFECYFTKSELSEINSALTKIYLNFKEKRDKTSFQILKELYNKKCDKLYALLNKLYDIVFN